MRRLGAFLTISALLAIGLTVHSQLPARAEIDCTTTYELRVEITDNGNPQLNDGLLAKPGAFVHFNRNIQTGGTTGQDYYDNGQLDDEKSRLGVIQENTACSADESNDYTASLHFATGLLTCEIIGNDSLTFDLDYDTLLEFTVDDCETPATATPTLTPTSTLAPVATTTPVVVTATPTPVPATVVPSAAPQVIVVNVQAPTPVPALQVFPTTASSIQVVPRISPPSTGDAGLLP